MRNYFERQGGGDVRIMSLSLGGARRFEIRRKDRSGHPTSVELRAGDLCIMDGETQRFYEHRIPPAPGVASSRINLTFRWVLNHRSGCPAMPADCPRAA